MAQQLTGKLMEMKLKHGWTLKEFANYLNVSEEEVIPQINREFSSKAAKAMLKRLEKNQSVRDKAINSRQKSSARNTFKMPEQQVELSPEEILKQREEELVKLLLSEEKSYKELQSTKQELKKSLAQEQQDLIKIQKEVKIRKENVQQLISQLIQTEEKITKVNINLSDHNLELNQVKAEIRHLNKLIVYVYNNGNIEAEDYNFEEVEYKENYSAIMEKEELLENLTIKQCKQLAKILTFAKTADRELEFVFDSEELQNVYTSFAS